MKLQAKPSDPIVVDRWLDVAYICLWVGYGWWGVTTLLVGLPTVNQLTSNWYQVAWSGSIGILSAICAVMVVLVFFETTWLEQISKKRIELVSVSVLCTFVAIYPVLLFIRLLNGDVDSIGGTFVLALTYLIFPALRLRLLSIKIKSLRAVTNDPTRGKSAI